MAKMRMFDAWENPIVNLPAEVQEYIDGIQGTILDCYSMSYGTPDGNVYCVEYTVTWVNKGHSVVTSKEFLYDFGAEGEKFRVAKDARLVDACSVLRWAHRLIEDSTLAEHWDFMEKMDKKAGVA
jgi:hypothetical protein